MSCSFLVGAALLLAACGSEPKEATTVTTTTDSTPVVMPKETYDPALTMALLDSASVASLLTGDKAWGIRVYNARREAADEDGTVVAIGITEARGKELMGSDKDMPYRRYQALSGDRIVVDALGRPDAQASVKWVAEAKDSSYCAEFSRAEVEAMLKTKDMKAIQFTPVIMPTPERTLYSLRAEPVTIVSGAIRGLGGSRICSEPCPTYCGDMPDYLWE